MIPLSVLDEFQAAGVFVNWWQQIRYDLKTIVATGWHHSLIPDEDLIAAFFQAEADAIEALDVRIGEAQSELAEAVEAAQEVAAYEPDEDEKVTAAVIKKALKALIEDLEGSVGESALRERAALQARDRAIAVLEKRIKDAKAELKIQTDALQVKLQLKRIGGEEYKAESRDLLQQVETRLANFIPVGKAGERAVNAMIKDKAALQTRLTETDALLETIGGQLTEEQAKGLILSKLYRIADAELNRYLNAEKRALIAVVENLWDKYAVSSRELERARGETLAVLDGFLDRLGYLGTSQ